MSDFERLKVIDLPSIGAQLHIHTDLSGNNIGGGSLKSYSGERLARLDNYQLAMGDFFAQKLGLDIKDK